jgi:hypothetical protein
MPNTGAISVGGTNAMVASDSAFSVLDWTDVAIMEAQLLLGHQLKAKIAHLALAALAVLAGPITGVACG